jgi:hypothetical protein
MKLPNSMPKIPAMPGHHHKVCPAAQAMRRFMPQRGAGMRLAQPGTATVATLAPQAKPPLQSPA